MQLSVDHVLLVNELEAHEVRYILISWLNSYIVSRIQVVKIHDIISDLYPVSSGDPEESHLSHLLFILFIN